MITPRFETAVRRIFSSYTVDLTPAVSDESLQHIRLTSTDGTTTFLLGRIDPKAMTAELRTLGHTLALSKARFGRELRLPPVEYMRFLENAQNLLAELGFRVTVVAYSKTAPAISGMLARAATMPYQAAAGAR